MREIPSLKINVQIQMKKPCKSKLKASKTQQTYKPDHENGKLRDLEVVHHFYDMHTDDQGIKRILQDTLSLPCN